MASLLSWGKRLAHDVTHNNITDFVGRDVAAPAQRAAGSVVHQAQGAVAQVNPADGGRTYHTVMDRGAQYQPKPVQSAISQLTHNGATNLVGGMAKGVVAPFDYLGRTTVVNPIRELTAQATHNPVAYQHAVRQSNIDLGLGANGRNIGQGLRRWAGESAQAGLTVATPGVGKAIDKSFTAVAPKIVPKLVTRTIANAGTGAVVGAPFNVASTIASDQPLTVKNLKNSAVQGAQLGAVLGGGGTLAGAAAPVVAKGTLKGAKAVGAETKAASDRAAQDSANRLQQGRINRDIKSYNKQYRQNQALGYKDSHPAQVNIRKALGELDQKQMNVIPAAQRTLRQKVTDKILAPKIGLSTNAVDANGLPIKRGSGASGDSSVSPLLPKNQANTGNISSKGSIAPHDKLMSDYADALKSMDSGVKGGQMIPDGNGSYTRISEHSPFYRQYFADNGRAPSKQAYLQEASKQFSTGKADPYAQKMYNDLQNPEVKNLLDQAQSGALNTKQPLGETFPVQPSNGFILKETKPRAGRQDVVVASRNPETGHLDTKIKSIDAPTKSLMSPKGDIQPNIELDRTIQDTLKTSTPEEAIQAVIDHTGADLQGAAKYVSRVAQQSGVDLGLQDARKNPLAGTVRVPSVKEGDYAQANLNAKFVQDHEHRVGQQALQNFTSLTPHDQVLLKNIETNTVSKVAHKADNPAAFKQAEQSIRNYYNLRHAYDRYLGIDVGYRTNYLRHVFDKVESQAQNSQISLKSANKTPGYTKARTDQSIGADVADALHKDITGASFNHAKLAYEKGMLEATGQRVARGELVRTPQDGAYVQLANKYGTDLSVPKDVAHAVNTRVWGPNESGILNTYDKLNHGLKYIKLSGGGFHAMTEMGNFVGQQIGSGKIVTNPAATGKLFKVFFSPKTMDAEMQRLSQNGTLDNASVAGLTLRPKDMLADVNVSALEKGTSKVAKYTGIQALHDATFAREMPYAKIKLFEQKTQGLDANKPADLAKMREVARGINNLVGGINREVHGVKPNSFRWLQRGLLATDFTEAKIQTLFSALGNKGPAGTLARQAVLGKALLFGVLATAGAAAGGEYKGKNIGQIAKNAGGNLLDPQFEIGGYTAKLPKTHISEAVDALKPTQQKAGAPWNASGLVNYAQARTAALPSELLQLATNKDYYGQPLYGNNTKKNGGGPIGPAGTAFNITGTVAPIPFGQGVKTATGKQNPAAAAANVAGLNVRPNPANSVTLQGVDTTLSDAQRRQYDSQLKTTNKSILSQLTNSTEYKALSPNDKSQAAKNVTSYVTTAVNRQFASKNSLGQFSPTYTGKGTQANSKEQQIVSGTITPTDFFPSTASTATKATKASKTISTVIGPDGKKHTIPKIPKATNGTVTSYDPKANIWTQTNNNTGRVTQIDSSGARTIVNKGIGAISGARLDYVANIRSSANKYKLDTPAVLAVAAAEGLGGGVGDNGTSYGPFQLHVGGALPQGKDQKWAESPAGIDYAMQQISKVAKGKKGQDAITAIVNAFERPADPNSEIARALDVYSGGSVKLVPGQARSGQYASEKKAAAAQKKVATARKQAVSTELRTLVASNKAASPIKTPARPHFSVKTTTTPSSYKQTALKQYAVQKTGISKTKRG